MCFFNLWTDHLTDRSSNFAAVFARPLRSSIESSAVRAVPSAIRHRVNRSGSRMLFCRRFTIRCGKQRRDIHVPAARTRKAPEVPGFDFLCQGSFWLYVLPTSLAITDTRLVFIAAVFTSHVGACLSWISLTVRSFGVMSPLHCFWRLHESLH